MSAPLTSGDSPKSGSAEGRKQTAFAGLLVKKERWLPSKTAVALSMLLLGSLVTLVFWRVHPFLAQTEPTRGEILVVEGWIPAFGLREAIAEFRRGGYREVITSGCLTHEDSGDRIGSTYADWGAQRLERYGLKGVPLTAVPCYVEHRDRTYSSALAVKQWLDRTHPGVTAVDVLTVGAHARRSRLLFQKALGDRIRVGIVSVPNLEYDPEHWWQSSEGVREILGEGIAYFYARFLFWPSSTAAEGANAP